MQIVLKLHKTLDSHGAWVNLLFKSREETAKQVHLITEHGDRRALMLHSLNNTALAHLHLF